MTQLGGAATSGGGNMRGLCIGVACAFMLVLGLAAGPADAAATPLTRWDTQEANVPYLVWAGSSVRLVYCTDQINVTTRWTKTIVGFNQTTDVIVETWGDSSFPQPSVEPGSVQYFWGSGEHNGERCVKATVTSTAAGLARIQFAIERPAPLCPYRHNFLVGWMTPLTPGIHEVSAATGPNDAPGGGGILGDASGDGNFVAGDAPGRVQVEVFGSLPIGPNWSSLTTLNGGQYPSTIRLPNETDGSTYWDDLAHSLGGADWWKWDIHDDRARTEGHVGGSVCDGPDPAIDAVDACLGADVFGGDGRYSTAFADLSAAPTIGPYDPLRPLETLLSDGKLDAGDVPMPSALVEVQIKPNTGGTDIGGIGSLAVADPTQPATAPELARWQGVLKCVAYTRDNLCNTSRHNHYAPYYRAWLPATAARIGSSVDDPSSNWPNYEASGVTGPFLGDNSPAGHLGWGLYGSWQLAALLGCGPGGATTCLRAHDNDPATPDFRMRPSGPQHVVVFSDEHGEAQVFFDPGADAFWDQLGIKGNLSTACDLEGIDPIGIAQITASARNPWLPASAAGPASPVLTKTLHSKFHKGMKCVPVSGSVTNGAATYICTAVGIDVNGRPFSGERVCFTSQLPGMTPYPPGTAGDPVQGGVCVRLDGSGNAAVQLPCKNAKSSVIANFEDEGIIRVDAVSCLASIVTTTTTTTTTTTPPTTTTRPPTTTTTPSTTTTTTVQQTTTTPPTTTAPKPCVPGRAASDMDSSSSEAQCPADVCPNLAGNQKAVPKGKVKVKGKCVPKPKKIVVKKAKKVKKKPKPKPKICYIHGRPVAPCVRGKG